MISTQKLFLITLTALGLAAMSQWITRSHSVRVDSRVGEALIEPGLVEGIDKIVIEKGALRLTLRQEGEEWKIEQKEGFPVNKQKLLQLLDRLSSIPISAMVSQDPTRFADFDLLAPTDSTESSFGMALRFFKGSDPVVEILFGKDRSSSSGAAGGQYVRFAQESKIYLLKEHFEIAYMPEDWMRIQLLRLDPAQVQSLQLEKGPSRLSLARKTKEDPFLEKNQQQVSLAEVETLLQDLSQFTLLDAVPRAKMGQLKLRLQAKALLTLFSGGGLAFEVYSQGSKEDQRYYLNLLPPPNEAGQKAFASLFRLSQHWLFEIAAWQGVKWNPENLLQSQP